LTAATAAEQAGGPMRRFVRLWCRLVTSRFGFKNSAHE
jgi:hypothetical protein